eukprot:2749304-Pyramimonas_sp.AAC.1
MAKIIQDPHGGSAPSCSAEGPVAKTPPPKRQSASPTPARAPNLGAAAETRAQAEEKAVPDTPKAKG